MTSQQECWKRLSSSSTFAWAGFHPTEPNRNWPTSLPTAAATFQGSKGLRAAPSARPYAYRWPKMGSSKTLLPACPPAKIGEEVRHVIKMLQFDRPGRTTFWIATKHFWCQMSIAFALLAPASWKQPRALVIGLYLFPLAGALVAKWVLSSSVV